MLVGLAWRPLDEVRDDLQVARVLAAVAAASTARSGSGHKLAADHQPGRLGETGFAVPILRLEEKENSQPP